MEGTSESGDDLAGSVDISLEYDDYPLDLISHTVSTSKDTCFTDFVISDGYDLYLTDEKNELESVWEIRNEEAEKQNGHAVLLPPEERTEPHEEDEQEKTGQMCLLLQQCCHMMMTKYHPMPEKDTLRDRCIYGLRMPPHGLLAKCMTNAVVTLLVWILCWICARSSSLPGGCIFAVFAIFVAGRIVGFVFQVIRVPAFIGMVLFGGLCRNIVFLDSFLLKPLVPELVLHARTLTLILVLIRGTASLSNYGQSSQRKQAGCTCVLLALMPAFLQMLASSAITHHCTQTSWTLAVMIGLVQSVLGSSSLVPQLQALQQPANRMTSSILQLAASIQHVVVWVSFSLLLSMIPPTGPSYTWMLGKSFLQIAAGSLAGLLASSISWYLPHRKQIDAKVYRIVMCTLFSIIAFAGSEQLSSPGSGMSAILVIFLVLPIKWRREGWSWDASSMEWLASWLFFFYEPIVYVSFGSEIDVRNLHWSIAAYGVGVVFAGLFVRFFTAFVSVAGSGCSTKERLFISLSWLTTSYEQIFMASYSLRNKDPSFKREPVLVVIALNMLITASLSHLFPFLNKRLLIKENPASRSELRALDPENTLHPDGDFESNSKTLNVNFGLNGLKIAAAEKETVT